MVFRVIVAAILFPAVLFQVALGKTEGCGTYPVSKVCSSSCPAGSSRCGKKDHGGHHAKKVHGHGEVDACCAAEESMRTIKVAPVQDVSKFCPAEAEECGGSCCTTHVEMKTLHVPPKTKVLSSCPEGFDECPHTKGKCCRDVTRSVEMEVDEEVTVTEFCPEGTEECPAATHHGKKHHGDEKSGKKECCAPVVSTRTVKEKANADVSLICEEGFKLCGKGSSKCCKSVDVPVTVNVDKLVSVTSFCPADTYECEKKGGKHGKKSEKACCKKVTKEISSKAKHQVAESCPEGTTKCGKHAGMCCREEVETKVSHVAMRKVVVKEKTSVKESAAFIVKDEDKKEKDSFKLKSVKEPKEKKDKNEKDSFKLKSVKEPKEKKDKNDDKEKSMFDGSLFHKGGDGRKLSLKEKKDGAEKEKKDKKMDLDMFSNMKEHAKIDLKDMNLKKDHLKVDKVKTEKTHDTSVSYHCPEGSTDCDGKCCVYSTVSKTVKVQAIKDAIPYCDDGELCGPKTCCKTVTVEVQQDAQSDVSRYCPEDSTPCDTGCCKYTTAVREEKTKAETLVAYSCPVDMQKCGKDGQECCKDVTVTAVKREPMQTSVSRTCPASAYKCMGKGKKSISSCCVQKDVTSQMQQKHDTHTYSECPAGTYQCEEDKSGKRVKCCKDETVTKKKRSAMLQSVSTSCPAGSYECPDKTGECCRDVTATRNVEREPLQTCLCPEGSMATADGCEVPKPCEFLKKPKHDEPKKVHEKKVHEKKVHEKVKAEKEKHDGLFNKHDKDGLKKKHGGQ